MTVSAPPRPPSPARDAPQSKPLERDEIEALVEALIEEARRETRRRHRRYWAVAALVTFVGTVVLVLLEGGAASQTASPALSARSSLPAAAASSKIAFISEPPGGGYCGVVYVMNPDGSGQRRLTNGASDPVARGCGGETDPAWSPDGRKIAFVSVVSRPTIYVMNADGSGQRELTPGGSPAWSPDGRKIAFRTVRDGTLEVDVVNADGSGKRGLPGSEWPFIAPAPAWSPDGRRIAFASGREGNPAIYVMNADGSGQRKLTRNSARCTNACPSAGRDSNVVWSPDGRRIAFVSKSQVYVMNADGSGQRRLTRNGARNFAPAWSSDGQRIAFERRVGRAKYGRCDRCGRAVTFQVYVMNADGSEARMLAQDAARPVWSPDGQRIAFEKHPHGIMFWKQSDISVMNADRSGQRNLTRGAGRHESSPVWSPAQKK